MNDSEHIPIKGLVIEDPNRELSSMITRLYIIIEIEGVPKPYIFDVTNDIKLRDLVCANLPEEEGA